MHLPDNILVFAFNMIFFLLQIIISIFDWDIEILSSLYNTFYTPFPYHDKKTRSCDRETEEAKAEWQESQCSLLLVTLIPHSNKKYINRKIKSVQLRKCNEVFHQEFVLSYPRHVSSGQLTNLKRKQHKHIKN